MIVDIVDKYCTDDNNPIKKTYAWNRFHRMLSMRGIV
jgi:hypothetical protein